MSIREGQHRYASLGTKLKRLDRGGLVIYRRGMEGGGCSSCIQQAGRREEDLNEGLWIP